MPKCPKCNEDICSLSYNSNCSATQIFSLKDGIIGEYSEMQYADEHSDDEYKCPECYETLFTDEEKATNFLKGIVVQEIHI
jgi:hypothetical protein